MQTIKHRPAPAWLPAKLQKEIADYNRTSAQLDAAALEVAQAERMVRAELTDGTGDPTELASQLDTLRTQKIQAETNRLHHIMRASDFNPRVREAAKSALTEATNRLEERKNELESGFDKLAVKSRWRQGCINETLHTERMRVGELRIPPDMAARADEIEDARARVRSAM